MSDLDVIIQRLSMRGHRVTGTRRRVLDVLVSMPAHFTVEDVLRHLPDVGRATVFRTMKLLQDLNLVCRVLMEDGSLHYRISARGHHHHLVCRDCGRIEDFSNCDVSSLLEQLSAITEYEIEGHWLEIYGRCSSCRSLTKTAVPG
ncbi:MAG: transcriptional repressor [Chloroflexi bacterium]|nr:transcriptional repressor [Chloroflexota bacterium]